MTFNKWIALVFIPKDELSKRLNYAVNEYTWFYHYPVLVCNDGFSISIQGGKGLYSTPDLKSEIYSTLEIGFPSEDDIIMNDSEDVRGYVTIEEIESMIERHGGIDANKSFNNFESNRYSKYLKNIRKEKMKRLNEI